MPLGADCSQARSSSRCRLLKPRSHQTFHVNPRSMNVQVEVRLQEDGYRRPVDQLGVLDASYFGSAELLLRRQIDSPCRFDVFALDRLVEQPMHQFGMFLFDRCGFFQAGSLCMDPVICAWLLQRTAGLYQYRNPYHNQLHAIDVTQAFYVMLQQPGIQHKFHLNKLEVFTTLLAALCHDVGHPGCTTKYLCLFNHDHFFKAYNDRFRELRKDDSKGDTQFTLENHHTRMGCSLLLQSGLMETLKLTEQQRMATVQLMSDLINATDMDRHKSLVEKFQADLLRAEEARQADSGSNSEPNRGHKGTVKMDLLELIIKCADIGNPFREWPICSAWAELVCQEFYRQGDLENVCRQRFMSSEDLLKVQGVFTASLKRDTQVPQVQVNFITIFVLPLIQVYAQVEATESSRAIQQTVEQNLQLWRMLNSMNKKKIINYLTCSALWSSTRCSRGCSTTRMCGLLLGARFELSAWH
ncbi:hypothetical protein BOX15_Mlig005875g3 [Macrostomum lignano]|uniref:PDEase domain-containing protein n=1 Tax=Macrostomum lignano TaxID=282301 RepID=A0A267G6S0_9PLAT|nr:hypothetical protein BOX15_Mlig005875g3 [Macrostomum lignano]